MICQQIKQIPDPKNFTRKQNLCIKEAALSTRSFFSEIPSHEAYVCLLSLLAVHLSLM